MEANSQQNTRSVLSLNHGELESLFEVAFWQDNAGELKVLPAEERTAIQVSNGTYLLRVYQDGKMLARLDQKYGEGVTFNVIGVLDYLESLNVKLGH